MAPDIFHPEFDKAGKAAGMQIWRIEVGSNHATCNSLKLFCLFFLLFYFCEKRFILKYFHLILEHGSCSYSEENIWKLFLWRCLHYFKCELSHFVSDVVLKINTK